MTLAAPHEVPETTPRLVRRTTIEVAAVAAVTALAAGVAAGAGLASGELVAVAGLLPLCGALGLFVVACVSKEDRTFVVPAIALAFALRIGAAALIYVASVALGKGGYTSGDDRSYAEAAWYVAQYWRGTAVDGFVPPDWNGYAYLLGTFTYLESAIFYVVGFQLLFMSFLNAALGAACVVPTWLITKNIFGVRPARVSALLVAVLPSLVVFSAVNLKDALNTFLVALVLLAVLRFQIRPGALALALAYVLLEPVWAIRNHIFVGLATLLPIAVALTKGLSFRSRIGWTSAAMTMSAVVLVTSSLISGTRIVPSQLLEEMERVRNSLAHGRTAIEEARSPTPGPTPSPTPSPTSSPTVTSASGSTLPSAQPSSAVSDTDLEPITATLTYIPTGLMYALFAPFPWKVERLADLASIPDTLAWYSLIGAMALTAWRFRSRWRYFAPSLLFVLGLLLLYALVEGNVGTLLRHRALFMPFAVVTGSPAIAELIARLTALLARRKIEMNTRSATPS